MRLRTLSEAECYARCYGARSEERVSLVQVVPRRRAYSTGSSATGSASASSGVLDERGPEQEAA